MASQNFQVEFNATMNLKDMQKSITEMKSMLSNVFSDDTISKNFANSLQKELKGIDKTIRELDLKTEKGFVNKSELKTAETTMRRLQLRIGDIQSVLKDAQINPSNIIPKSVFDQFDKLARKAQNVNEIVNQNADVKALQRRIQEAQSSRNSKLANQFYNYGGIGANAKSIREKLGQEYNSILSNELFKGMQNAPKGSYQQRVPQLQKYLKSVQENWSQQLLDFMGTTSYNSEGSAKALRQLQDKEKSLIAQAEDVAKLQELLSKMPQETQQKIKNFDKSKNVGFEKMQADLDKTARESIDEFLGALENTYLGLHGSERQSAKKAYDRMRTYTSDISKVDVNRITNIDAIRQSPELTRLREKAIDSISEANNFRLSNNENRQLIENLIASTGLTSDSDFNAVLEDYQKKILDVQQKIQEGQNLDKIFGTKGTGEAKELESLNKQLAQLAQNFTNLKQLEQTESSISKLTTELENLKNSEASVELGKIIEQIRQLGYDTSGLDSVESILKFLNGDARTKISGEVSKQIQEIYQRTVQMNGALDNLKEKSSNVKGVLDTYSTVDNDTKELETRVQYFFKMGNAIQLARRAVQDAYKTVQDLDKSMTEIAVVSDFSVSDMWDKLPQFTEHANKLGVAIKDVYDATALYVQQGLDLETSMGVADETLKMARISGLQAAAATDSMTASLRGFGKEVTKENAQNISDVYSKLAAISASDVEELSTAMTKTASIAHSANMEFENTAAFLAQMIETTRESADAVGTSLKTIISRFGEVKNLYTKGQIEGSDEEGQIINVNDIQAALRSVGISMKDFLSGTEGLDSVLMQLAKKWNTLDFATQRFIATTAAGSRQQSRFMALLQDYNRTLELTEAAQDAEGASQEQYEKTMESMDAKLQKLSNSWAQFTMGIANQDVMKNGIDGLTEILNLINSILDTVSGGNNTMRTVLTVIGSIGAFKGGKIIADTVVQNRKLLKQYNGSFSSAEALAAGDEGIPKTIFDKSSIGLFKRFRTQMIQDARNDTLFGKKFATQVDLGTPLADQTFGKWQREMIAKTPEFQEALERATQDQTGSYSQYWTDENGQQVLGDVFGHTLTDKEKKAVMQNYIQNGTLTLNGQPINFNPNSQQINDELSAKTAEQWNTAEAGALAASAAIGMFNSALKQANGESGGTKFLDSLSSSMMTFSITAQAASAALKLFNVNGLIAASAGGWIGLTIAGITLLVQLYDKFLKKETKAEKTTRLADEAKDAKSAYEDATNELEKLNSALDELTSKEDAMSDLIAGTEEWKSSLKDINSTISEIVGNYPDLAQYIQFGQFGQMSISQEGQDAIKQRYQDNVSATRYANAAANAAVIQDQIENLGVIDEDYITEMLQAGGAKLEPAGSSRRKAQIAATKREIQNYWNSGNKSSLTDWAYEMKGIFKSKDDADAFVNAVVARRVSDVGKRESLSKSQENLYRAALTEGATDEEKSSAYFSGLAEIAAKNLEKKNQEIQGKEKFDEATQEEWEAYAERHGFASADVAKTQGVSNKDVKKEAETLQASTEAQEGLTKALEVLTNPENGANDAILDLLSGKGLTQSNWNEAEALTNANSSFATKLAEAMGMNINDFISMMSEKIQTERDYLDQKPKYDSGKTGNLYSQINGSLTGTERQNWQNQIQNFAEIGNQGVDTLSQIFQGLSDSGNVKDWGSVIDAMGSLDLTDAKDLEAFFKNLKNEGLISDSFDGSQFIAQVEAMQKAVDSFSTETLADSLKSVYSAITNVRSNTSSQYSEDDYKGLIEAGISANNFVQNASGGYTYIGGSQDALLYNAQQGLTNKFYRSAEISAKRAVQGKQFEDLGLKEENVDTIDNFQSFLNSAEGISQIYDATMNKMLTLDEYEAETDDAKQRIANQIWEDSQNWQTERANVDKYQEAGMTLSYNAAGGGTEQQKLAGALNQANDLSQDVQYIQALAAAFAQMDEYQNTSLSQLTEMARLVEETKSAIEGFDGSSWDEWATTLTSAESSIGEILDVVAKIQPYAKKLLHQTQDISPEFLKSADNLELMKKALEGDESAIKELGKAYSNYLLDQIDDADAKGILTPLVKEMQAFADSDDLTFTPTVESQGFIDALNAMIQSGEMGFDQLEAIASSLDLVPEWETEEITAQSESTSSSSGQVTVGDDTTETSSTLNTETESSVLMPVTKGSGGGGGSKKLAGFSRAPNAGGGAKPQSSGGGGGSKEWENPYDKLYNLTEKINEQLRIREKLERQYDLILKNRAQNAEDVYNNMVKQIGALEYEKNLQQEMLDKRNQQAVDYMNEKSDMNKYGRLMFDEGGNVRMQIDWDLINSVTDSEEGGNIQKYISKLEEIRDNIRDTQDGLDDIQDRLLEIYDLGKDEYFDIEQRILDAIVYARQQEIDRLSAINDSLSDTSQKVLDGIQDQIDKYRQDRDNADTEKDLADQQRQLVYMQQDTSGANQVDILQLQEDIKNAQQDYTDTLIDQKISELEKQNEKAQEQRELQIKIMEKQLEHDQETGALWQQAYDLMADGFDMDKGLVRGSKLEEMLKASESWQGLSNLDKVKWLNELEENLKAALNYLKIGRSTTGLLAKGELKEGDSISFTDKGGNVLKGTVQSDGSVIGSDGTKYTGIYQNSDGSFIAGDDFAAYEPVHPTTTPTGSEDNNDTKTTGSGGDSGSNVENSDQKKYANWQHDTNYYQAETRAKIASLQSNLQQLQDRQLNLKKQIPLAKDEQYREKLINEQKQNARSIAQLQLAIAELKKLLPIGGQTSSSNSSSSAKNMVAFATGGAANFTGPAWLDGTPTKPEIILNQKDSQNFIKLKDILSAVMSNISSNSTSSNIENGGDNYFDIDINVDKLDSDYSLESIERKITSMIYNDASYRGVNVVRNLR